MRLLHTKTYQLQEFTPGQEPEYSILSHTWGTNEITYEDIAQNGGCLPKTSAASKIRNFCKMACRDRHGVLHKYVSWVWVDTCCINKSSSAELQEAINSMFNWYKSAAECFVYLEDVQVDEVSMDMLKDKALKDAYWRAARTQIKRCRWLTRGWTLQEFIASQRVTFYDREWNHIGRVSNLREELADMLGMPTSMIGYRGVDIDEFEKSSLQERVYWARNRQTTRPEDRAYSLLGLLNVSMPMIYGEGKAKAIKRLKREVREEHGVELNFEYLY